MPEIIHNLINYPFCIQDRSKDAVLKVLDLSFCEYIVFDGKFDRGFLFDEAIEHKRRFILFEAPDGWTFLRWNEWGFEENQAARGALGR